MSYDSVEVLAHFAARKGITVSLLSDPTSEIIRRFAVFNDEIPESDARQYGMPHPGTFVVDEKSIIRDKFFEAKYVNRVTMGTILARAFTPPPAARASSTPASRVTIATTATEDRVRPGNRFTLVAEVTPAPGVHIYAPGSQPYGYQPLALTIEPPHSSTIYPVQFPEAKIMEFPALGESVPVYARPVRVMVDITLGSRQEMAEALSAGSVTVRGRFALQACDEAECYAPQEIPVAWEFVLEPVDTERVPEGLRREIRGGGHPA